MFDRPTPPGSTSAAESGSTPPERLMRVAPLDLRQQKFRTVFRGLDRTEVVAFLTEAADDWLARAQSVPGAWWPHWYAWLDGHRGPLRTKPRSAGSAQYPPLGPAPGNYVREPAG